MLYRMEYESPLGTLTAMSDGESLVGLFMASVEPRPEDAAGTDLPVLAALRRWLDAYFDGGRPSPADLPLAPAGTEFQRAVWRILLDIPYGRTTTYGAIAAILAERNERGRMAPMAVGGAVGRNPISIVIPCHRVVGAGGNLVGYGGGMDRKVRLLTLEGVDMSRFYVPGEERRV